MIKILELRSTAIEALGDDFDIRGFHDTVLVQVRTTRLTGATHHAMD